MEEVERINAEVWQITGPVILIQSVTGRVSNFRGILDSAGVNLQYRDGEINERTSSLLLSSLPFASHRSSLPSIDPCFAPLVALRPSHAKAELEDVVLMRGP